ncbi:TPM domain-containing protein [Bordetella genomosp. 1]|uniref:TPM domain-containing protein n=1 Tax=Bordetella genomosp. 1 TaxID=1395607 RepID=A0ABX4F438_9BORD|nr:TPM domain-containing protein [Bordetella genomosp. 1]OZI68518.1 hypothetical protein CAL27_03380 [Bordetella genomosp. 1]
MTTASLRRASRQGGAWLARLGAVVLAWVCFAGLVQAQKLQPIPAPDDYVTDAAGVLDGARTEIAAQLRALERRKTAQVAVLIVKTTKPESIEQYATRVFEQWKIGQDKANNGVLLLVASEDRTLRIEVGYGLEGTLPDALANRIISRHIVPYFQNDDMAAGIDAGTRAIVALIDGDPLPSDESAGVPRTKVLPAPEVTVAVPDGNLDGVASTDAPDAVPALPPLQPQVPNFAGMAENPEYASLRGKSTASEGFLGGLIDPFFGGAFMQYLWLLLLFVLRPAPAGLIGAVLVYWNSGSLLTAVLSGIVLAVVAYLRLRFFGKRPATHGGGGFVSTNSDWSASRGSSSSRSSSRSGSGASGGFRGGGGSSGGGGASGRW